MSEAQNNITPSSATNVLPSTTESNRRRTTIGPRDSTEALVSLQAASVQLETAYRRMRQARRNIVEMADSAANADSGWPTSGSIGPGHEAITLTSGSETTDINRTTQPTPVESARTTLHAMQEQLRQIETRIEAEIRRTSSRYGELFSPMAGASSPPRQSPSSASQLEPIGSRRPRLGSLRTTNLNGVEGSTSLGRRVALRELAGSVTSPSSTTSASSFRQEQDVLGAVAASTERANDLLRTLVHQRRLDTPGGLTSGQEVPEHNRRSLYVSRSSTRSDTSNSPNAEAARRRRVYGTTSSTLSQSPMSTETDARLSLLSNFSVQNLPTPVSGTSPRALIFEEPTSYIPAANFIEPTSNTRNDSVRESQDERSYVVRRRYNADGEEYVHSINMEWADDDDDDPMAWMLSREAEEELGLEVVEGRVGGPRARRRQANHQAIAGRRRTWVRLDADGDEIIGEGPEPNHPSPNYHIRIHPRPYAPIPASFLDSQEAIPLLSGHERRMDIPSTRVPRPPGIAQSDSNSTVRPDADASPKVALNTLPSNKPSYANPLPMPIESMAWPGHKAKQMRVVKLPKHASFACR